jgi:hypothetical protein
MPDATARLNVVLDEAITFERGTEKPDDACDAMEGVAG